MADEPNIWVENRRWSESWTSLQDLPGGGQGVARKARRKRDGRTAFVKAIKAKRNAERRARFFREASAYDTIRVPGIPGLIESNAHHWENVRVEPVGAAPVESGRRHAWHTPAQCRLNPGRRPEGGCYHGKMYSSWQRHRAEASAVAVAITLASCAGQSVEFRHWKTSLFHCCPGFEIDDDALYVTPR